MDENIWSEIQQQTNCFCRQIRDKLSNTAPGSANETAALWQEFQNCFLETAAAVFKQQPARSGPAADAGVLDKIEADAIIAEVIDKRTGNLVRRRLPVQYLETDNGVILSGETIEGLPASIAFFSDAALAKMKDLCGGGPDTPRCRA